MLGFGQGEARLEVGEDKTLQHFDGGRQEGNGSIGGALAVGFPGLGMASIMAFRQMAGIFALAIDRLKLLLSYA